MNLTDLLLEPGQEQGPSDPIDRVLEHYPLNRMLMGDGPDQIRERGEGKSERVMIRRALKNLTEAGLSIDGPGANPEGLPILDVQATFNREGLLAYAPDFNFSEQAGPEDRAAVQQALQEQGLMTMVTVKDQLRLVPQSLHRLRLPFGDDDIHWQLLTVDPIDGVSLAQMREWMAVDVELFCNPYLVSSWIAEGLNPQDLVVWLRVDRHHFSQSKHIAAWQAVGADHEDAATWYAAHRGFAARDRVEAWQGAGLTLADARAWGAVIPQLSAVAIETVTRLLACKPSEEQRQQLQSALQNRPGLVWSELVRMTEDGASLERICEMAGLAPDLGDVCGWARTSLSAAEVSDWVKRGFSLSAEATSWMAVGLTAAQAQAWREGGARTPSQAKPWIEAGLTVNDMLEWKDAYYSFTNFQHVQPWIEAGFGAEQAKAWAGIGIHQPGVVQQWQEIGPPFDTPEGVKPLRAEVITPKQARVMLTALHEHASQPDKL